MSKTIINGAKGEENPQKPTEVVFHVGSVPVQVLAVLHVEQHRGDQFVHVLRLPDDGLQLVIHSLPHHALQTFDPSHTDPETRTEMG